MPRIMIKGGVWRNTEDEILKAAVMKYGKNQWARIASLLHRKSAKQCKARWFEWLNPSIKKTDWSKEEEEKLLHMAKLMPTQWRTIAPIVGRTATQCLEHYEYLLDKAENRIGDENYQNPRNLRVGEIDPLPEAKPAKPDPIDMDEDELEMLSEARARLANTQGKKAKRKARERQLGEARRLASLQKTRELKAAGIGKPRVFKFNKRTIDGVDYAKEIPFQKKPLPGFHDTSSELYNGAIPNFHSLRRSQIEEKSVKATEVKAKEKDAEHFRKRKENNNDLKIAEPLQAKRNRLILPEPQISDVELEKIVKSNKSGTEALNLARTDGKLSSKALLQNYESTRLEESARSMNYRTPANSESNIMRESRNLIALNEVDTPLKGGENTPLVGPTTNSTDVSKIFKTPCLSDDFKTPSMTPNYSQFQTPIITPIRDNLNTDTQFKENLLKDLQTLPLPKNDFDIVLSQENEDESELQRVKESHTSLTIEDKEQTETYLREMEIQKKAEEMKTRSQVIQRNLERPCRINSAILKTPLNSTNENLNEIQKAEELIKAEMLLMLHYDYLNDPSSNQLYEASQQKNKLEFTKQSTTYLKQHDYAHFQIEEINSSRDLINQEIKYVKKKMEHGEISSDVYSKVWNDCYSQILYLPDENRHVRSNLASKKERINSYSHDLEMNRKLMTKEAKKASKLEKKIHIYYGGYKNKLAEVSKKMDAIYDALDNANIEFEAYKKLKSNEEAAIPKRIWKIKEEVIKQVNRENNLQKKYENLQYQLQSKKDECDLINLQIEQKRNLKIEKIHPKKNVPDVQMQSVVE
ncbi:Pre-mRNA-splicing factor CEF1 [Intoshia linei]|uniref:Pre-mRNA-splicing factor CEF1 n=1 Tax=Intoshia linei TaxID=1819745 RepID=A0A177B7Q8_9BILA|nr:Pre-mRNA-splicing factor CEF1 [Intoshia linei]